MDPLVGAEGPAGVAGAVGGVPGGVQGGYHTKSICRILCGGKGLTPATLLTYVTLSQYLNRTSIKLDK